MAKSASKDTRKTTWMVAGVGIVIVLALLLTCWVRATTYAYSCKTENLKLTPGQGQGAAGTIYQHMIITNVGKHRCKIIGYPTTFLYGSNGFALGNSAAASPQPAPVNIVLDPNGTANTLIGFPQAGNFNPGVCSDKSTSIHIYPPSSMTYLEAPLNVAWCPGFSETALQPGS